MVLQLAFSAYSIKQSVSTSPAVTASPRDLTQPMLSSCLSLQMGLCTKVFADAQTNLMRLNNSCTDRVCCFSVASCSFSLDTATIENLSKAGFCTGQLNPTNKPVRTWVRLSTVIRVWVRLQQSRNRMGRCNVLNFDSINHKDKRNLYVCGRCYNVILDRTAIRAQSRLHGLCAFHSKSAQPAPPSIKRMHMCSHTSERRSLARKLLHPLLTNGGVFVSPASKSLKICDACYSHLTRSLHTKTFPKTSVITLRPAPRTHIPTALHTASIRIALPTPRPQNPIHPPFTASAVPAPFFFLSNPPHTPSIPTHQCSNLQTIHYVHRPSSPTTAPASSNQMVSHQLTTVPVLMSPQLGTPSPQHSRLPASVSLTPGLITEAKNTTRVPVRARLPEPIRVIATTTYYDPLPYTPRLEQWDRARLQSEMKKLQQSVVELKPYSPSSIAMLCDASMFQSWMFRVLNLQYLYNHYYKTKTNETLSVHVRHTHTMFELLGDSKKANKNADILSMARAILARYLRSTRNQIHSFASSAPGSIQSVRSTDSEIKKLLRLRVSRLQQLVLNAISHQWLVLCGIDDYFNYKSKIRPRLDSTIVIAKMANIILVVIKVDGSAVPLSEAKLPDLMGCSDLDIHGEFESEKWCQNGLAKHYTNDRVISDFLGLGGIFSAFSDHDTINRHLRIHHYQSYNTCSEPRSFIDCVHLVDCVKNNSLHSFKEMSDALNVLIETMRPYLHKFCTVFLGDFPVLRNTARLVQHAKVDTLLQRSMFIGMNPLHISLNAQETVVNQTLPVFKMVNETLFGTRWVMNCFCDLT